MDSLEYITALHKWDAKRCEEHKFPILTTVKYVVWGIILTFNVWTIYNLGYVAGHFTAKMETIQAQKEKK